MTKLILALVLMVTALTAFAQHRPGPGRPGPGGPGGRPGPHYPGPGRPGPGPGPGYPGPGRLPPRPMPPVGYACSVLMIDNWQQVYRSYAGRTDYYSGRCSQAMDRCIYDLRFNRGLRCVEERGRW